MIKNSNETIIDWCASFKNLKDLCKWFISRNAKTQLSKIIQSGGALGELIVALINCRNAKINKKAPEMTEMRGYVTRYSVTTGIKKLERNSLSEGSEITVIKNEIKGL